MARAVVDSTVLVSALLKFVPGSPSHDILELAAQGAFELYLSDDIIEETARVLLTSERIRQRYDYADVDVVDYCRHLAALATLIDDPPVVQVVRDPNDDMIVACAVAASAEFLVTRDKDMLSMEQFNSIRFVTPEAFLHLLRAAG